MVAFIVCVLAALSLLVAGCTRSSLPGGVTSTLDSPSSGLESLSMRQGSSEGGGSASQTSSEAHLRKIVVFQAGVSQSEKDERCARHGSVARHLSLINASVVLLPEGKEKEGTEALLKEPGVVRVDDDLIITAIDGIEAAKGLGSGSGTTQPAQTVPWGVSRIHADQSWGTSTGTGVKVAVVDTGIDLSHPDLAANVKGGYNAIQSAKSYNDDNGHGTHVAGTIAALNNTIGVVGAGYTINLYAVKVLDRTGSGWLSDIIEGLNWCVTNGMKVASMSLGSSSDNQSFHDAVTAACNAGVTLVAAAGNSSGGAVSYPARYPEVIAVTASDSQDHLAYFSSVGPEVDLIAPGVDVPSTYKGGGYKTLSGTSMACPHVSGAAALKLAVAPLLTPADVAAALKATATPLPGLSASQQGSGLVDALKVVTQ